MRRPRPRTLALAGGLLFALGIVGVVVAAGSSAGHVGPPRRTPLRLVADTTDRVAFEASLDGDHVVTVRLPSSAGAAAIATAVGPRGAAAPAGTPPPPLRVDVTVIVDRRPVATGSTDDDRAPGQDAHATTLRGATFVAAAGTVYDVVAQVAREAPTLRGVEAVIEVGPSLALRERVSFGGAVRRGVGLFVAVAGLALGTIALVIAAANRRLDAG